MGNKVSYSSERLMTPGGVAVDDTGFVYYTDNGLAANRGMIWKSRINSENGRVEATEMPPRYPRPSGIAVDNAGSFYVGNSDSPKHS